MEEVMIKITPERQALVDKVTKLLALADSTTHGPEADSARQMAATLMAKHNIASSDMSKKEAFETMDVKTDRASVAKYESILLKSVANFNGVAIILVGTNYRFIGAPSDLAAFEYMRDTIYQQRTSIWRAYYPAKWGKHPGAKELNKWKLGFAFGVAEKVRSLTAAMESKVQEWGLVPVDPAKQALDWYKIENTIREGRGRSSMYNADGREAGKNVTLNKGVEAQGAKLALT
jgi:hypothetical protein